ncbi:MAG: hypothetical protein WEB93_03065 [Sphingomonadales bacterium]
MSDIVLGLATSHSPLLTFDVDTWIEKAAGDRRMKLALSDGRTLTYGELSAEVGERYSEQAQRDHLENQRLRCQRGLDLLADELEKASPDLVVIVGDDQGELFSLANMPAISIFYGAELVTHPWGEMDDEMPAWKRTAAIGYGMDRVHRYPGAPDVAMTAIKGLIAHGVDVAAASAVVDPGHAGFGHAYGFVVERLFRGRSYPVLPVLLNTYFPPNVPTSARCFDVGALLADVLEKLDGLRIAVVASGGLSHFVTDEVLDRGVMNAMRTGDTAHLRAVPPEALRTGSSEILNWIMAAGALQRLPVAWNDYVPVFRTPAGTGIGMGFMVWRHEP